MAFSIGSATIEMISRCNHCSGLVRQIEDPSSGIVLETFDDGHDSDCIQRLVPCPFAYAFLGWGGECNEKFKFRNLLRDCESKHGKMAVMKNGTTKTIEENLSREISYYSTLPVKIEAYGRVFITESVTKHQVYYQWVKLLGSPTEAEGFIFSLEYQGSRSTHAYFGNVASINDTVDDVISSGKSSSIGFTIFKNQFMENCNDENYATLNYSWSITIKKLDE